MSSIEKTLELSLVIINRLKLNRTFIITFILLSFLLTLYFFIPIFIFAPEFYHHTPTAIIFVISFCLGLILLILNILVCAYFPILEGASTARLFLYSGVQSILTISVLSYAVYRLNMHLEKKMHFYEILDMSFIIPIAMIATNIIRLSLKSRKDKREYERQNIGQDQE